MAQLEDGWPLGLQPLNARVGLVRNLDRNGSVSFSTFLTGSPTSSTGSSSDLDTQSTGSFFRDRSITLGSLIGVSSSILELSRRSMRRGTPGEILREKKSCKLKPWLFSLCSRLSTDAVVNMNINNNNNSNAPSLGHFLEAERRAATIFSRNQRPPLAYGPDDFSHALPVSTSNTLFVDGNVAPPPPPPPHQSSTCFDSNGERRSNRGIFEQQQQEGGNGYGSAPLSFSSCLCRQLSE